MYSTVCFGVAYIELDREDALGTLCALLALGQEK